MRWGFSRLEEYVMDFEGVEYVALYRCGFECTGGLHVEVMVRSVATLFDASLFDAWSEKSATRIEERNTGRLRNHRDFR